LWNIDILHYYLQEIKVDDENSFEKTICLSGKKKKNIIPLYEI